MKNNRAANGEVLTVIESARLLRIGRNAVYEAIHRGEIPHFKIGRSIRVPKAGLLQLLGANLPDVKSAWGLPQAPIKGKGASASK